MHCVTFVKLFYENLSAGRESSENKPVEEAFSSQQNPVPTGQDILPTGEQDEIVFKDPYIDPASGDWILNEFDIECIAIGAGILGCGGGGSPYLGRLRALELIRAGKEIHVIHPNK